MIVDLAAPELKAKRYLLELFPDPGRRAAVAIAAYVAACAELGLTENNMVESCRGAVAAIARAKKKIEGVRG